MREAHVQQKKNQFLLENFYKLDRMILLWNASWAVNHPSDKSIGQPIDKPNPICGS